jgi:CDP-diacylglycerol--glycerol-3-phosphate 3-phosphatidyltransferase
METLLIETRTNRILKELIFLPNLLSIFRILLSPVFVLLVLFPDSLTINIVVLSIFIMASITDFLDGYLARKLNLITDTGKVLDPIADKFMVGFFLIVFAMLHLVYWWVAILIIFREVFVTIHRFYLLSKGEVIGAEKSGKLKMGSQVTMIIVTLLWLIASKLNYSPQLSEHLHTTANITIWLALILTILSGVDYFVIIYIKRDFTFSKITLSISTLFGLGHISKMPGTLGSIASIIFIYLLCLLYNPVILLPVIVFFLYSIGVFCTSIAEKKYGHDASIIIIDEFVGQIIPFLFIPEIEIWHFIAGLGLFRFFDILKPLGINKSQKLPKGWGVMTDDLIAGVYSFAVLHAAIFIGKMYF